MGVVGKRKFKFIVSSRSANYEMIDRVVVHIVWT